MDLRTTVHLLRYLHRIKPSPEVRVRVIDNGTLAEIIDGHPGRISAWVMHYTGNTFDVELLTTASDSASDLYAPYANVYAPRVR